MPRLVPFLVFVLLIECDLLLSPSMRKESYWIYKLRPFLEMQGQLRGLLYFLFLRHSCRLLKGLGIFVDFLVCLYSPDLHRIVLLHFFKWQRIDRG